MKKLTIVNLLALAVGIGAIVTLVFFLLVNYHTPFYVVEPNTFIKNCEIVMGLFAIPVIMRLIYKEFKEFIK